MKVSYFVLRYYRWRRDNCSKPLQMNDGTEWQMIRPKYRYQAEQILVCCGIDGLQDVVQKVHTSCVIDDDCASFVTTGRLTSVHLSYMRPTPCTQLWRDIEWYAMRHMTELLNSGLQVCGYIMFETLLCSLWQCVALIGEEFGYGVLFRSAFKWVLWWNVFVLLIVTFCRATEWFQLFPLRMTSCWLHSMRSWSLSTIQQIPTK